MPVSMIEFEILKDHLHDAKANADALREDAMLMRRLKANVRGHNCSLLTDKEAGYATHDALATIMREIQTQADCGE